jgi:chaperonin GroES
LLDRVLVRKLKAPTKSVGGVLLPESAQKTLNEGIVLAVGPGRIAETGQRIDVGVKVGDKVLLPEYGGNSVKVDDEDLLIYRDEDILAIFEQNN